MTRTPIILIALALLLGGCGESVSERSANQKRDYKIDEMERDRNKQQHDDANRYADGQLGSAEQRLRSLEDRVTALEKR